jgi:hypothetical protein
MDAPMTRQGWDQAWLREQVVEPVLEAMLTEAELASSLVVLRPGPEAGGWTLVVTFPSDEFTSYAYQPASMAGWTTSMLKGSLAEDLQDFLAESSFAWGQLRRKPLL